MWYFVWKTAPVTIFYKGFNLYSSQSQYFYEVELAWNVFPKLSIHMFHFCVLFQKLLSLIFFFHILHPLHYVKIYCQKQCYKSQWNWEKQTPSQNKCEWETYCPDFLMTEEFFLSSVTWEEGESFNRKLYKLLIFWMFAVIMVLEVTVFLKAVKWHQNTAAEKVKLNLWVVLKTHITLRQRKKQKSFPYHSMLSFFHKVRWNCLMKIFCLRGKKVGVFQ